MKYMGSKARIAKEILPLILAGRKEGQFYVEPFCGGCNLIDKVGGNRIASDSNATLINIFIALTQNEWVPPANLTEMEYYEIKRRGTEGLTLEESALYAFASIPCSYGAKLWGGFARNFAQGSTQAKYRKTVPEEAAGGLLKQKPNLKGVKFIAGNYFDLVIPPQSIIYCDPPYEGTTGYKVKFDHGFFWQWCEVKAAEGHRVFVSEYKAPPNWGCIWEKQIGSSLTKNSLAKFGTEKLFKLEQHDNK